jgi:hypothetical protein
MATYLARQCPRCNGYLGVILREPGRNVLVRCEWALPHYEGKVSALYEVLGNIEYLQPFV